jgi:uncharacterized protein YbjT (DUF2867 family)
MGQIIIAGASGLIGGFVVGALSGRDIVAIGRRRIEGLAQQSIGPVEQWPAMVLALSPRVAISTLGTTIRDAGSPAAFAAIDHDAVVAFAAAAKAAGARQFVMVSSVGARLDASNFYLKTKGRAEANVCALGFERVDIVRPGLLTGARPGANRPFERVMVALSPLTDRLTPRAFDQYRSIAAERVAGAIAALVDTPKPGNFVHHNREMLALLPNRA